MYNEPTLKLTYFYEHFLKYGKIVALNVRKCYTQLSKTKKTKKGCIIMNKTQLIQVVADKTELSRKDAEAAVNAVFEAIVEAMKAGDKVQLIGFGAFGVKEVAAKKYVDRFGGGREVTKPAYKKPTFIAGKALKDALN